MSDKEVMEINEPIVDAPQEGDPEMEIPEAVETEVDVSMQGSSAEDKEETLKTPSKSQRRKRTFSDCGFSSDSDGKSTDGVPPKVFVKDIEEIASGSGVNVQDNVRRSSESLITFPNTDTSDSDEDKLTDKEMPSSSGESGDDDPSTNDTLLKWLSEINSQVEEIHLRTSSPDDTSDSEVPAKRFKKE